MVLMPRVSFSNRWTFGVAFDLPQMSSRGCHSVRAPPTMVKEQLGPGSRLQDDMLLAPFLHNRDLLYLSKAATWLLPYRNQRGDVTITEWCDDKTPAELLGERRLHTVFVQCPDALLRLTAWLRGEDGVGVRAALRRLNIPSSPCRMKQDFVELAAFLAEGVCGALEELNIDHTPEPGAGGLP
jgi:hypothetical protein